MMEQIAATNAGISADIGGTFRVRISEVAITGEGQASASTCSNYAEASFVDAEGQYTPEEAGMGEPARNVDTLRDVGGVWQVATSEYTGPC